MNTGGRVEPPENGGSDTVPGWIQDGYVIPKRAAKKLGWTEENGWPRFIDAINAEKEPT